MLKDKEKEVGVITSELNRLKAEFERIESELKIIKKRNHGQSRKK